MTPKMKQHIEDAEKHMIDYNTFHDARHISNAVDDIIEALKESVDPNTDDRNKDTQ